MNVGSKIVDLCAVDCVAIGMSRDYQCSQSRVAGLHLRIMRVWRNYRCIRVAVDQWLEHIYCQLEQLLADPTARIEVSGQESGITGLCSRP